MGAAGRAADIFMLKLNSKYHINISGEGGNTRRSYATRPLPEADQHHLCRLSWHHNSGALAIDDAELLRRIRAADVHKSPSAAFLESFLSICCDTLR
jgi:hypothetical protein